MTDATKDASNWWPLALWSPVNIPLAPVWQGSAVVSGGKVYLIGGSKRQVNVQPYQSLAVDPAAGSIQLLPPMRTPRYGAVAGIVGNQIVVAGGVSFAGPEASEKLSSVEIYNTGSNTWTQGPPLPYILGWAAGGIVGNRLIVTGGVSEQRENRVLILDMSTGRWQAANQMPAAISHAAATVYNGKLYIFGGIDWKSSHQRSCYIFDAAANNWTIGTPMPDPRASAAAVVLNNEILITGGTRDIVGLESREVFVFNPAINLYGQTFPMNSTRGEHVACQINGTVYAIGGNENCSIELASQNFSPIGITPDKKEINIQYKLWSTQGPVFERPIAGTTEEVRLPSFRVLVLKPIGLPSTPSLLISNNGLAPVRINDDKYNYVLQPKKQVKWQLLSTADIHLTPVPT